MTDRKSFCEKDVTCFGVLARSSQGEVNKRSYFFRWKNALICGKGQSSSIPNFSYLSNFYFLQFFLCVCSWKRKVILKSYSGDEVGAAH